MPEWLGAVAPENFRGPERTEEIMPTHRLLFSRGVVVAVLLFEAAT